MGASSGIPRRARAPSGTSGDARGGRGGGPEAARGVVVATGVSEGGMLAEDQRVAGTELAGAMLRSSGIPPASPDHRIAGVGAEPIPATRIVVDNRAEEGSD